MKDILIAVELTPEAAQKIRFMAESAVFEVMDGNVTLTFKNGHLKTIKRELFTYSPS